MGESARQASEFLGGTATEVRFVALTASSLGLFGLSRDGYVFEAVFSEPAGALEGWRRVSMGRYEEDYLV